MKLGFHALLVMNEACLRQPIKTLGVLIIDADVVSQGVAPGAHFGSDHGKIESVPLAREREAHFVLACDILKAVDGTDNLSVGIAQRSDIDAGHPTLSIRVLDDRLGALETLT